MTTGATRRFEGAERSGLVVRMTGCAVFTYGVRAAAGRPGGQIAVTLLAVTISAIRPGHRRSAESRVTDVVHRAKSGGGDRIAQHIIVGFTRRFINMGTVTNQAADRLGQTVRFVGVTGRTNGRS